MSTADPNLHLIDDLHDAMALGHARPDDDETVLQLAAAKLREFVCVRRAVNELHDAMASGHPRPAEDETVVRLAAARLRKAEKPTVQPKRAAENQECPGRLCVWPRGRVLYINAEVPQGAGRQFHDALRELLSQFMGVGTEQVAEPHEIQPGERL